jgi:hypothetical protein
MGDEPRMQRLDPGRPRGAEVVGVLAGRGPSLGRRPVAEGLNGSPPDVRSALLLTAGTEHDGREQLSSAKPHKSSGLGGRRTRPI